VRDATSGHGCKQPKHVAVRVAALAKRRRWRSITCNWGYAYPSLGHATPKSTFTLTISIHEFSLTTFKMRLQSILPALLLPLAALAAKKPSSDRFADAFSKPLPVKLDDSKFTKLSQAPRDYTAAVLLTAMEARFGCEACHNFQPEWELLSRSWQKGDKAGKSRVLFGTLDFLDGKGTFQAVRNMHSAEARKTDCVDSLADAIATCPGSPSLPPDNRPKCADGPVSRSI
jgi:OST3 / OST6 family, transporter family